MKIKVKTNVQDYVDNEFNAGALTPGKVYSVLGVSDEFFRFLNDDQRPFLYPKKFFIIVDPTIPDDWVKEEFDDGEYYIDPPLLSGRGFYEDYFDNKPYAVQNLKEYLQKNPG